MQIMIEIPKDRYKEIVSGLFDADAYFKTNLTLAFRNGTPIPDNATNGDVMKAIFKPNRITRTDDTVHIDYDITPDWWDAPYQKGGKE